jgi:hypothetical protein
MSGPFIKFTDAVKDYEVDWTAWLDDDVITASTWTPDDSGIVVQSMSHTATTTTVWLSGGPATTDGNAVRCVVINHITTTGGRQEDYILNIDVRSP